MTAEAEPARLDLRDPAALIATCFGAGLVRWAPGTVASALALPFAWLLRTYTGTIGLAIATLVLIVVGIWAAGAHERRTGTRDSSAIVIDEVAGQFVALLLVPPTVAVCAVGFRAVPPVRRGEALADQPARPAREGRARRDAG